MADSVIPHCEREILAPGVDIVGRFISTIEGDGYRAVVVDFPTVRIDVCYALDQVSIIVINRPKRDRLFSVDGWKRLDEYLTSGISGDYIFSESRSCYLSGDKQPIFIFEVTALDISSTKIRSLIKETC